MYDIGIVRKRRFVPSGMSGFAGNVMSGPSYSLRGGFQIGTDPSGVNTFSYDLGPAASDRFVVLGLAKASGVTTTVSSVLAAGTALSAIRTNKSAVNLAALYAGLVSAGAGFQNVVVTDDDLSSNERVVMVWVLRGLSSLVPRTQADNGSTNNDFPIGVAAKHLLFCANCAFLGSGTEFDPSTEPASHVQGDPVHFGWFADWGIQATNAAFSIRIRNFEAVAATWY